MNMWIELSDSASLSVLLLIPVFTHCHYQYYQERSGKKRRQVFREDVSPLLGGRVPSSALEWTRLMFNNLDSRGISIPNGFIPSPDRVHSGALGYEKRIVFFSNDSLEPFVASTYRLRNLNPTVPHRQRIEIIPDLPHETISPEQDNGHGCCNHQITEGLSSSPTFAFSRTPSIIPNPPNVKLQVNAAGAKPKEFQSYFPKNSHTHREETHQSIASVQPVSALPMHDTHLDNYKQLLVDDIIMKIRQSPYILLTTFPVPRKKRRKRKHKVRKLTLANILKRLL